MRSNQTESSGGKGCRRTCNHPSGLSRSISLSRHEKEEDAVPGKLSTSRRVHRTTSSDCPDQAEQRQCGSAVRSQCWVLSAWFPGSRGEDCSNGLGHAVLGAFRHVFVPTPLAEWTVLKLSTRIHNRARVRLGHGNVDCRDPDPGTTPCHAT